MNDFQQQQPQLMGTKKRRHMPNELFGRFSSKVDFIRYFKEQRKSMLLLLTCLCQSNCTALLTTCSTRTS